MEADGYLDRGSQRWVGKRLGKCPGTHRISLDKSPNNGGRGA